MNNDAQDLLHFFENTRDLLCIAGFDGFFRRLNPAWEQTLGYTPEELMARPYVEFLHPDDVEATIAEAQKIYGGATTISFKNRYRCKDGTYRWLAWWAKPDAENQTIYAMATDITDRQRMEERLLHISEWQQAILDSANLSVISTRPDGVIQTFNLCASRMLGYSPDEVIDKVTPELIHDRAEVEKRAAELSQELGYEVPPGFDAFVAKARLGQPDENEWTYLRKDGTRLPVLLSVTALRDEQGVISGFLGIARDVSERKRAEERFRSLLEAAPEGIVIADQQNRIVLVNAQVERVFGYPREELLEQPVELLVPERFRQPHSEQGETFFAKLRAHALSAGLELYGRRKDGSEFPMEFSLSPQRTVEGTVVISSILDISERKQAEEKARLAAAELARSNAELEQFAYIASHDLQEPLRMVTNFLQLLNRRIGAKLDPVSSIYIATAMDGARRMRALVHDLLAYSRVGTRGKALVPIRGDDALRTVLRDLGLAIQEHGATITHDPLPTVLADEVQFRQLLQNLIGNAIKFHGTEPPKVHLGCTRVAPETCEFTVSDNGIGIAKEFYDRIFVIFQRLHTRKVYDGTGIGLAICKKIVERHGGTIWVTSNPGAGTTFHFTLHCAGEQPESGSA